MTFEVGETVVYPHHGAARIIDIRQRKVRGEEKTYLQLEVAQGDLTILVPADSVDLIGVRDVVDDLPPTLREVLILNSFEELGYEEIARILDIPVGTVSSRIYAARRKLAARLRRLGPT